MLIKFVLQLKFFKHEHKLMRCGLMPVCVFFANNTAPRQDTEHVFNTSSRANLEEATRNGGP